MNYYSLASGFLSAKYTSLDQIKGKARERTLGKYFTQRGLRILDALQEVSAKTGASGAQIALAWLLQKPAVTAPIVSATSIEQLDDLLGCFKVGLDPDLMQLLDQASQEQ